MGHQRTSSSGPTRAPGRASASCGPSGSVRASARCSRTLGSSAEPEHPVGHDRVADVDALGLGGGVVVGRLVGGHVGPHLQAAGGDVAAPRERRTATHSPTGAAKATVCVTSGGAGTRRAQQGGGEAREHDPPRGCSDRARPRHWAGSIWTALPRLGTAAVPPDTPPRAREPRRGAASVARDRGRASIAAWTRALTTGLSGSASGCHCTPSTKRRSGSSIASGSSSRSEMPLTTRPSPSLSTP